MTTKKTEKTKETPVKKVVVNTNYLNLRKAPDFDADVAAVLERGMLLDVFKDEGLKDTGWIRVEAKIGTRKHKGYVVFTYTKEV